MVRSLFISIFLFFATINSFAAKTIRPIELVVPTAPGGGTDIVARIIATDVTLKGQPVVVVNKPGAERSIAANYVATADADGYTLFMGSLSDVVMLPLFQYPGLKFNQDLTPISFAASQPAMISVAPDFPANNLKELLSVVKSNPKKYSVGSFGKLSTVDAYILFSSISETPNVVNYKGDTQMLTDIIGGAPLIGINSIAGSRELALAGKIKYIATTSERRLKDFPTVETTEEYKIVLGQFWHGVFAPPGTDPAVAQRLHELFNRSIQDPQVQNKLDKVGYRVIPMSRTKFIKYYRSEFNHYESMVNHIKENSKE